MAFYERAFDPQKGRLVYGEMQGDVPLQLVQDDFARK
jgi:hypothetical protein